MKQIILTLFVGLSMFIGGCDEEKKATDATESTTTTVVPKVAAEYLCTLLETETKLDFGNSANNSNVYFFNATDMKDGEKRFYNTYKFDNDAETDNANDIVNLDSCHEIISLNTITSILDELTNSKYPISKNYYSAIKIHYGMDGKKLIPLLEPIVLIPDSSKNPNKKCKLVRCSLNKIFKLDNGGGFAIIDTIQLRNYIEAYTSNTSKIYINHNNKEKGTKFFKANSLKEGDVESTVMSLQQIIRMYADNAGDCKKLDEKIKISFVANLYNGGKDGKPHIVASYNFGTLNKKANSFQGLGADFSQLCPDQCGIEIDINNYADN